GPSSFPRANGARPPLLHIVGGSITERPVRGESARPANAEQCEGTGAHATPGSPAASRPPGDRTDTPPTLSGSPGPAARRHGRAHPAGTSTPGRGRAAPRAPLRGVRV